MSELLRSASASSGTDRLLADLIAEITDKLHTGEHVNLEEYVTRYPERAEELRRLVPALAIMDELHSVVGASGLCAASPDAAALAAHRTLGDFRLIREIGRGGMGIVYEAEQLSLDRRVALKVLPFAVTMDSRQLHRFQNEARAAASLEHPHIVPVYAVGCERGVHFYAMKLIEGQSLAELIQMQAGSSGQTASADLPAATADSTDVTRAVRTERSPRDAAEFRQIAAWGLQAALALEHAHGIGIVHRDIKPANLMIDRFGVLWVTDFGLARTAADAGLTTTGNVLGTLRYMSPEQALARHGLVDHRTDIYSLGVTLYELLTLIPAVQGRDREQILNGITLEEPPSPRQLDPAIPRDLETVLLKMMAKDPEDRYGTAKELAEDLERWVAGEAIMARPPSRIGRPWRWCRRNPVVAGLTGTVALLVIGAIVGVTVAAAVIGRKHEQTKSALALARTNYALAETQRLRAESNFGKALNGMTQLLEEVCTTELLDERQRQNLQEAFSDRIERFVNHMQDEESADPVIRMELGWAYQHLGTFYTKLEDYVRAEKNCRKALEIHESLEREGTDDQSIQWVYSQSLRRLGTALYLSGQVTEGKVYLIRSLEQFRHGLELDSNEHTLHRLANLLATCIDPELRDPEEAIRLATRAIAINPNTAGLWHTLGNAHFRSGKWETARHDFEEFLRLRIQQDGTETYFFLAMIHWKLGDSHRAQDYYGKGLRTQAHANHGVPGVLERQLKAEAADLLGVDKK